MAEIARALVVIFAFSAFCGLGLALLCAPSMFRRVSVMVWLVPSLGLLQLAIVDGYLIAFSRPIHGAIVACAVLGACELLVWNVVDYAVWRFRASGRVYSYGGALAQRVRDRLHELRSEALPAVAILLASLAIVLTPLVHAGALTMPFRVGIDQVGYAETAQYLVEGGTLASAKADILKRLETRDFTKAKVHNIYALNFGTYVDTEFLLKALRWGFPGVIASLTLLTKAGHVYRVEFISLFFCLGLALQLFYLQMIARFGVPPAFAAVCAAAFAFNVNMLNVYYEGQLAETFAEPFLMLMLFMLLGLREGDAGNSLRALESRRTVALFAVMLAGLFFAYNEALVLLYAIVCGVAVLDLLFVRTVRWRALWAIGSATIVGALLALPISAQWFRYTLANLSGLSHAGFWQPHWASLAEILGVFNMYGSTPYVLLARSSSNEIANVVVSIVLAAAVAHFLFTQRGLDKPFWALPFVLVAAVYLRSRLSPGMLNYPYTKLFTLLLPFIAAVTFAALHAPWQRRAAPLYRLATSLLIAAMFVSGASFVGTYLAQGGYVTEGMFQLYAFDGQRRFNDLTLEMPGRQPIIRDFMLTPLVSLNWVNEVPVPKYVAPYLNRPLAVLLWRSDLPRNAGESRSKYPVIYQNQDLIVLLARRHLADICIPEAGRYRIDSLSDDPTDSWKTLPPSQCRYDFADAVQREMRS